MPAPFVITTALGQVANAQRIIRCRPQTGSLLNALDFRRATPLSLNPSIRLQECCIGDFRFLSMGR